MSIIFDTKANMLKERLLHLSKHYRLSIREFEKECGLKRGNISNMGEVIGSDKLSKIIDRFPDVNLYWLVTGNDETFLDSKCVENTINHNDGVFDGEIAGNPNVHKAPSNDKPFSTSKCVQNVMVANPNKNHNINPNCPNVHEMLGNDKPFSTSKCVQNVLNKNEDIIEDKIEDNPNVYKTSSNDKPFLTSKCVQNVINSNDDIVDDIIDDNPNVYKTSSNDKPFPQPKTISLPLSDDLYNIPITDISAAAGGGTPNSDYYETSGTLQLPKSMIRGGTHICINIDGKSMEPTLRSGSKMVIRHLDRADWRNIANDHIYVVTDRDGNTYIKRVDNHLSDAGYLTLRSDNSDRRNYAPFDIMESELHNVWVAEWYLTSEIPRVDRELDERVSNLEGDIVDIKGLLLKLVKRS